MTENYNPNDCYDENVFSEEFKSKEEPDNINKKVNQENKINEYLRSLLAERSLIDEKLCPYAYKFIDDEISRVQQKLVKGPPRNNKYVDIYHERPLKLSVKVLLPIKEHPRFNFIGKLLGQKGSTLKQLQEDTKCYMNICGRGSMRDRLKEEELRRSLEPKYAHLSDDLHIEISTIATPAEAHSRIASALKAVRKYVIPEFSQNLKERDLLQRRSILGKIIQNDEQWETREPNDSQMEEIVVQKGPTSRTVMHRSPITSKSSVMSILNKARIAMQETRGFGEREARTYGDSTYKSKRYFEEISYAGENTRDVNLKKQKNVVD